MAKAPKIIKFPKQGIRLRAARAVAGFEHAVDLADKLGILQNTYTTYERGEREFPTEHLAALIEHTGFPAAYFLLGDLSDIPPEKIELLKKKCPGGVIPSSFDDISKDTITAALEIALRRNKESIVIIEMAIAKLREQDDPPPEHKSLSGRAEDHLSDVLDAAKGKRDGRAGSDLPAASPVSPPKGKRAPPQSDIES